MYRTTVQAYGAIRVAAATRDTIQTIARAAALMRVLEHAPDGLSLGQLAEGLEPAAL